MTRMTGITVIPLFAILATLGLAACSSKPTEELEMARKAMSQAQTAEAPEYTPYDWQRGLAAWYMGTALMDAGRNVEARSVLIRAVGEFNTARDEANRRLSSVKIEVTNLQANDRTELETVEKAAASSEAKPIVKKHIEAALPFIEQQIQIMNEAARNKQYISAREAGRLALHWIYELRVQAGIAH
jgi:hypothetical protein